MSQNWDADQYVDHAAFVAELGLPVLVLLEPRRGERILDLGCGDGALAVTIAKSGAMVHGVDSSPSMVERARKRGVSAEVKSGENLSFRNRFDAVFSNAALHWMRDADAVLEGVFNALKPGGRWVGEFGGEGNVAALVQAMERVFEDHSEFGEFENPWYFPGVDEYRRKLQQAGFKVQSLEIIPRPTPLSSGVREWLKIFSQGITKNLSEAQRDVFLNEVEEKVRPSLQIKGQWVADYVRLRFSTIKPD